MADMTRFSPAEKAGVTAPRAQMKSRTNLIAYWVSTVVVIAFAGLGSLPDLLMLDEVRHTIQAQGFPPRFLPFFGAVKLAATYVVVVAAVPTRFKYMAYSGLFFYFVGALYSHVSIGDAFSKSVPAIIAIFAVAAAYLTWRRRCQDVLKS